jgi:cardiolipin synthase
MNQRNGIIVEQKETQEVDYGNLNLGDVWTKKESITTQMLPSEFKLSNRIIFPIPSADKEALVKYLTNMVNQATNVICLSSYMIQKSDLTTALLTAASRGVRVYILTAGEEELERVDTDIDDVDKEKVEGYKSLLNQMAGQVLIRTAKHFHAKFLLVDPKRENQKGVMMTCNATVDAMTGRNLEAAMTLNSSEIVSFFSQFTRAFWLEAKHELLTAGRLDDILEHPKSISFQQVTHPATLSGYVSLRERVKSLIDTAEKTVIITGWSFGANHPILESLARAAERGVIVKVFTRVAFGNTESLVTLVTKGITVQGHDRYHAKMVIVDSNKALLMTSNFTEKGLDSGFETGIELQGDEIQTLNAIINQWEHLCEWKLCHNLTLKATTTQIRKKNPATKKMDTIEVNNSITKELAPHTITSLDNTQYKPSFDQFNPNTVGSSKLFKKVIYAWRLIPPVLPTRAQPLHQAKEKLPVYRMPSGESFVTVKNWEDIEPAKPIAAKWKAKIVLPTPNRK